MRSAATRWYLFAALVGTMMSVWLFWREYSDRPVRLPPVESEQPELAGRARDIRKVQAHSPLHEVSTSAVDRLILAPPMGLARLPEPEPREVVGSGDLAVRREIRIDPPERLPSLPPSTRLRSTGGSGLRPETRRHVLKRINEAVKLAERGAAYSARSQLIECIRWISQNLDAAAGGRDHLTALAEGMRALDEADDFFHGGAEFEADLEVESYVAGHATEILKGQRNLSPVSAVEAYYAHARERLLAASGGESIAGKAYYALGRLENRLRREAPDARKGGPRAIPLYEVSLSINPKNSICANELGVALAREGQLKKSVAALAKSARLVPNRTTLANLEKVYDQLGDPSAAQRVRNTVNRTPSIPGGKNRPVLRLVSQEEFFASDAAISAAASTNQIKRPRTHGPGPSMTPARPSSEFGPPPSSPRLPRNSW